MRNRLLPAACALALLACGAALGWLARAERGGPTHLDMTLPGGIPATLYLTGGPAGSRPQPPEPGERAPAVLLVHGYTADRASLGVLARRLARNGYAALAIDVRGHGANRRGFTQDLEGAGLFEDLAAAADWLRGSSYVDGSRLAVIGHSMGAGAALRFAERDVALDAAVMISGGWALLGPHRPPNALFVYAAGDPQRIRDAAPAVAARLAGVAAAEDGERYGDFGARSAVRALEIPGTDHGTILWSAHAAREIVAWLDASFGAPRGVEPELAEPRAVPALLLALALPLALVGIGRAAGSVAPAWPHRAASARGLPALALGLALALPAVAVAPLASFLGMDVADVLGAWLFYAGLLLAAGVALRGERVLPRVGERAAGGAARGLAAGGAAFAGAYALVAPLGVLAHGLVPTPERALAAALLAALLLPFFLASETLLRRGGAWQALALGLLGKLLVLAVLVAGIFAEIVPAVLLLLLGALAAVFVVAEIAAAALYARSGNLLASAVLQAALLGWTIAALMPVRA
jgi:alpha-beta hydrolase superfamily lysophospholipase